MKKKTIIFIFAIIAAISVWGQKSEKTLDKSDKAKEEVTALVTEFADAVVKGDTITLDSVLSGDYFDFSNAPTSKKMLIDYFKETADNKKANKLTAIDISNPLSVVFYDNVSIVRGIARVKWKDPGNKIGEGKYLVTLFACKKQDKWQIAATHYSDFIVKELK